MADSRHDDRLFLVDPPRRGIIPLDNMRISRRLARTIRSGRFSITVDRTFNSVVEACASPQTGRAETWINRSIHDLCCELHDRGMAHSVETWREGRLVGGLYGISLAGAFFGESMFSTERDASKVALVYLVERLRAGGYALLDAQFLTEHLKTFGAIEITKAEYRRRLEDALTKWAHFG